MNEARVALLGLGAVAVATFVLTAGLVYRSVVLRERVGAAPSGAIGQAFMAAPGPTGNVAGLERLLPAGTPRTRVLERLAADGFACTFETKAATCFRSVGAGRNTSIWTLWLTFDNAETLTSSQGERRAPRP